MSEPSLFYRWLRVYATGGAIIGVGVLCYKYLTPTEEQLYERFSPEIKARHDRELPLRYKEQEELIKIVKKTSASNDPIWMTGPIKSPFEARQYQMKEKERMEREVAGEQQQQELVDLKAKLEQAKPVEPEQTQKKRGWW